MRKLLCLGLFAAALMGCRGEESKPKEAKPVASEAGSEVEASTQAAVGGDEAPTPERPRLVVVLVIDQMRADFVDRFGGQWTQGLRRVADEGMRFTAAYHAHALTETAPGHATISTGVHPAKHGIVANRWWDRVAGRKVNAVDDRNVRILGNEEAVGASPATLRREALGDWLQAQSPESVVVSISLKDRAAILMGGKRPDAAVWYDDAFGGYTTSSYYGEAVPGWVAAYNGKGRAEALYGTGDSAGWRLSYPPEAYGDARRETPEALVATFNDYSLSKRFPHVITEADKGPRNVIRDTPFGDRMSLELAVEAVAAENMGGDATPDLLFVSLSGGDYAGHRYGPGSIQVRDYYLQMDAAVGTFLAELDARVGKDRYLLVLTADHGVAPFVEFSPHETALRFAGREAMPQMLAAAAAEIEFPGEQLPRVEFSHGIELLFAEDVAEEQRAALRAALAKQLRARKDVADAWTRDELAGQPERKYAAAWQRSFDPERSSDLLVQLARGGSLYPVGTGHGTPYAYDQHVPLIVVGPGLGGTSDARREIVDIAPTLAQLLGIEAAAGVDGQVFALE